ncbi:MAG: hypothetical protein AB1430_10090 [Pseudomonadota bacterium]
MPHRPPTPAAVAPEQAGLQLDQNLRQQRREWWLQRVAWVLFTLLLLAVALGLAGQGPLSHEQRASADGTLRVEYQRFLRRHTPETLELQLQATSDRVLLRVDNAYLHRVEVENLFPEPREVWAEDDATVFEYRARPGGRLQVRLTLRPESPGRLRGWVSADGGEPLRLAHFVYP